MNTRGVLLSARAAALALGAMTLLPVLADAVLVAPHALFISHEDQTGEVYLVNQGDVPEEVTVQLRYGYPATDSSGAIGIRFVDVPGPEDQSAAEWMRAFPRRARIEPGQRQRVRIQATPPGDLTDGEYWTRLVVVSRSVEEEMVPAGDTAARAGVRMELRTVTSVAYRKGEVSTGVRLDGFNGSIVNDSLEAWVQLTREGNAAYLGTIRFELLDTEGTEVRSWATPIAVYFDQNRRFVIPILGLDPGYYRLRLLVSTAREDIDPRYVLPAPPVERTVSITIE